jgi:hypothetical protein
MKKSLRWSRRNRSGGGSISIGPENRVSHSSLRATSGPFLGQCRENSESRAAEIASFPLGDE